MYRVALESHKETLRVIWSILSFRGKQNDTLLNISKTTKLQVVHTFNILLCYIPFHDVLPLQSCLVVAAMKCKYNVKSQHRTEMRVAMVSLIPKFDKLVQ